MAFGFRAKKMAKLALLQHTVKAKTAAKVAMAAGIRAKKAAKVAAYHKVGAAKAASRLF
jgi:hypothetical protein